MNCERYGNKEQDYLRQYCQKEKIIYTLIHTERNREKLAGTPHRNIMDLSLTYRFVMDISEKGIRSVWITDSTAKQLDMTEKELYQAAVKNTPRLMPLRISEIDEDFYMITNEKGLLGAAAMLYDGVLETLAGELDCGLYILPASIHEVLLLPAKDYEPTGLQEMVRCVNSSSLLAEEEVLSNHIYYYNREEGSLQLACDCL